MTKACTVNAPKLHPDRLKLKIVKTAALLLVMSSVTQSVSHAQTGTVLDRLDTATPKTTFGAFGSGGQSGVSHAQTGTVLDTLDTATPKTTFSVFGSGGQAVSNGQIVGPQFTLTRRSVLTKIGAFINNCNSIISGVPQCPNTLPFVVQIRRSINGLPDPSLLIAATPLSHDNDPLTVSFESAELNDVPLEAGTYFALFAPQQAGDAGLLLGTATGFVAGLTTIGFVNLTGSSFTSATFAAVRIIARPVQPGRAQNAKD
jgi:hypothetical protein